MSEKNSGKKNALSTRGQVEAKKNEVLDAAILGAKKQTADDLLWGKELTESIQNKGLIYSSLYRIWRIPANILSLAGESLGKVAQIFPPLNAVMIGLLCAIDLVEAIFLSKETRNRRVVKAVNNASCTALTITATVLILNPATAPLGAALSAVAMVFAVGNDAFFWYKARRDLRIATKQSLMVKAELDSRVQDLLNNQYKADVDQIKDINHRIEKLEKNTPQLFSDVHARLLALRQEKNNLILKLDDAINRDEIVILKRQSLIRINDRVQQLTVENAKRKADLTSNTFSLLGAVLLTVFAFATAAVLLSNPIGLGITGVVLLSIGTVVAIKSKYFSKKLEKENEPKKVEAVEAIPLLEQNSEAGGLYHNLAEKHNEEARDTEQIVHRFVENLQESERLSAEKKILQSDIAYHDVEEQGSVPAVSGQVVENKAPVMDENLKDENVKDENNESSQLRPKDNI